ncbi:MAG: DNA polymerase III subunit delta [Culicoidibacterales bacterium]
MIYFLQGTEQYFITQKIKEITQMAEIIYVSATETAISQVFQEVCTDNLFGGTKVVVINDLVKVNLAEFLELLTPNIASSMQKSANCCIFIFNQDNDLSATLQKQLAPLLAYANIINVKQKAEVAVTEFINVKLASVPHNLSPKDIKEVAQLYKNNIELILAEINRAKLEKLNTKQPLTLNDFTGETFFLEEEVFGLMQKIEEQKLNQTMKILDNILLHQQNIFGLLALLLKNYKQMYQIRTLANFSYTQEKIAKRLEIHPYRTKLLLKTAIKISDDQFKQTLNKIISAEIKLKSGRPQDMVIKELILFLFRQK